MLLQATYSTCSLLPEIQETTAPTWNPVCHITYTRDTWVKLFEPKSEYSYDEALLLCQESLDTWVVWIPDHGEMQLDRSDFYC
jgi:hypothetical protein